MERDTLMTKEKDEDLLGMVVMSVYKDDTYSLSTSFEVEDTYELLKDAILDFEDGSIEESTRVFNQILQ
jgi:hypothetical protein